MLHEPSLEQIQNCFVEQDSACAVLKYSLAFARQSGIANFGDLENAPFLEMIDKLTVADSKLHFNIDEQTVHDIKTLAKERMNVLHKEIKEMHLPQDHEQSIYQKFNSKVHNFLTIRSCACCGIRTFDLQYRNFPIEKCDLLLLSDEQLNHYNALGEFKAAASVYAHYEHNDQCVNKNFNHYSQFHSTIDNPNTCNDTHSCPCQHYFLHPEAIDVLNNEVYACLCSTCQENLFQKKKLPKYSIAAGSDFGDASRLSPYLEPLTLASRHLLGYGRMYASFIKISADSTSLSHRKLVGHVISFLHDGPVVGWETAVEAIHHAHNHFKVAFVGLRDDFDKFRDDIQISKHYLQIPVRNFFNWLQFLKHCNPIYYSLNHLQIFENPSLETCSLLEQFGENMLEKNNVVFIDDKVSIQMDKVIGQDNANVRMVSDFSEDIGTSSDDFMLNQPEFPHCFLQSNGDVYNTSGEHVQVQAFNAIKELLGVKSQRGTDADNEPLHELQGDSDNEVTTLHESGSPAPEVDNLKQKEELKVQSHRVSDEPVNEFEDNDRLYLTLFPHLFMFGTFGEKLNIKGSLPEPFTRLLVQQRSLAFAQDRKFLFLAVNQRCRHQVASSVAATACGRKPQMQELGEKLNSPEFKELLESSENNPTGENAKKLLNMIDNLLSISGRNVEFSQKQKKWYVAVIYAYVQFFGIPVLYVTIAPDDVYSCIAIRLSISPKHGNTKFPATDDGLLNCLQKGELVFNEQVKVSNKDLHALITANPVAAAQFFKLTIDTVFEVLFGMKVDHKSRQRTQLTGETKGAIGKCRAAILHSEIQQRITLHGHAVVWLDLVADLVNYTAMVPALFNDIRAIIDRSFKCSIPLAYHLEGIGRLVIPKSERSERKRPCLNQGNFFAYSQVYDTINSVGGVHGHLFKSCKPSKPKKKVTKMTCRLNHVRETTGDKTDGQLVELKYIKDINGNDYFEKISELHILHPTFVKSPHLRNFFDNPFQQQPHSVFCYQHPRPEYTTEDLQLLLALNTNPYFDTGHLIKCYEAIEKLPEQLKKQVVTVLLRRNEAVVSYNDIYTACLSCNTCIEFLGALEQAKSALFYLIDYINKNKVKLGHCLSIIREANEKRLAYPSQAEDKGTSFRDSKYLLNIIHNKLNGMIEIGDTQSAALLIGMPTQVNTHKTVFVFTQQAVAFVLDRLKGENPKFYDDNYNQTTSMFQDSDDEFGNPDSSDDDFQEQTVSKDLELEIKTLDRNTQTTAFESQTSNQWGKSFVRKTKNKQTGKLEYRPILQCEDYAHRGEELRDLHLMIYCCIIETIEKPKSKQYKTRTPTKQFDFGPYHPNVETHCQRFRSKFLIPMLTGGSPPSFKSLDVEGATFSTCSRYEQRKLQQKALWYMVMFCPWKLQSTPFLQPEDLMPELGTSWESFTSFVRYLSNTQSFDVEAPPILPPQTTYYNRWILRHMQSISRNLHSNNMKRKMITQFRTEKADDLQDPNLMTASTIQQILARYMKEVHAQPGQEEPGSNTKEQEQLELYTQAEMDRIQALANDTITKDCQSYCFLNNCLTQLHYALPATFAQTIPASNNYNIVYSLNSYNEAKERIATVKRSIEDRTLKRKPNAQPTAVEKNASMGDSILQVDVNNAPYSSQFRRANVEQKHFLNDVANLITTILSDPQNFKPKNVMLITGGPGVGKTFCANTAKDMMAYHNILFLVCSTTGVAASLISAETIHTLFRIPIFQKNEKGRANSNELPPLSPDQLLKLRRLFLNALVLVIDEISMLDVVLLNHINKRLQQIKQHTQLPFGGLQLMLFGDYFQERPVGREPLYVSILDYHNICSDVQADSNTLPPNNNHFAALLPLSDTKLYNLTIDERCKDIEHSKCLQNARNFDTKQPFSQTLLEKLANAPLKPTDFSHDSQWYNSFCGVTSNLERFHLQPEFAKNFAKFHKVPIVMWRKKCVGTACAFANQDGLFAEKLYHPTSGLVGMFVPGAPCMVNQNINPALGISNGTIGTYRALFFENQHTNELVNELIEQAGPTVVWLPENVVPTYAIAEFTLKDENMALLTADDTLEEGKCMIPIGYRSNKTVRTNAKHTFGTEVRYRDLKADLAFVLTIHKLQGMTLERLILQLNYRRGNLLKQLSYNSFLVAISRVEYFKHIRIIPLIPGSDLKYIGKLKPDFKLKVWMQGFNEENYWNPLHCKQKYECMTSKLKTRVRVRSKSANLPNKKAKPSKSKQQDHKKSHTRFNGPSAPDHTPKRNKTAVTTHQQTTPVKSSQVQASQQDHDKSTNKAVKRRIMTDLPQTNSTALPQVHELVLTPNQQARTLNGLQNNGQNICFLNSVIQAISTMYPFSSPYWLQKQLRKTENHPESTRPQEYMFQGCKRKFLELMLNMHQPQQRMLHALTFLNEQYLRTHFFGDASNYQVGNQMDAAEFFGRIFEECRSRPSCHCNLEHFKKWESHFQFRPTQYRQCLQTEMTTNVDYQYEENILQLAIIDHMGTPVQIVNEAFQMWTAHDLIESYNCDLCHGECTLVNELQIKTWPKSSLVIQLKLFDYDIVSEQGIKKIHSITNFANMDFITEGAEQFHLQAVVCHQGPRVNSGHYVTYIRNRDANNARWIVASDSNVSTVHAAHQFNTNNSTPYLLFYSKQNSHEERVEARTELDISILPMQTTDKLVDCQVNAFLGLSKLISTNSIAEEIFLFSSQFFQNLFQCMLEPRNSEQILKQTDLQSHSQAFRKPIWLFPIAHRDHWWLAIYNRQLNELQLATSLYRETDHTDIENAFATLVQCFGTWRNQFPQTITVTVVRGLQRQQDAVSCGVFVCWYGEQLLNGRPMTDEFNVALQRNHIHSVLEHRLLV